MKQVSLYDKVIFTGFTVIMGLAALYPYQRMVTLAKQPPDAAIAALPTSQNVTPAIQPSQGDMNSEAPSLETGRSKTIAPTLSCPVLPTSRLFARTELFFGLSKQNASEISDTEFQQFLRREVTPRFPDGLTVLTGRGQFKNSSGLIIKEPTQVLILLYPLEQASKNSQKIQQIQKSYKTLFQQESVLRTDEISCVSF
jgi:hypothetical protein